MDMDPSRRLPSRPTRPSITRGADQGVGGETAPCVVDLVEPDGRDEFASGYGSRLERAGEDDTEPTAHDAGSTTRTGRPRREYWPVPSVTDLEWLAWTIRFRYATVPQLVRRFGITRDEGYRRTGRLRTLGLLAYQQLPGHGVYLPTRDAARLVGTDLPVPQFSYGTWEHETGVVDLGLDFELAGELVVTDREIRGTLGGRLRTGEMEAAREVIGLPEDYEGPMFTVGKGTSDRMHHVPDLVCARKPLRGRNDKPVPGSIAIELELNMKRPSEWRSILTAYATTGAFAHVLYYAAEGRTANGLLRAVEQLGLERLVTIRPYTPSTRPRTQVRTPRQALEVQRLRAEEKRRAS